MGKSAEVVHLAAIRKGEESEVDEAVVELAEQFLEKARAGKVRGLVLASVQRDGEVGFHLAGCFADEPALGLTVITRMKRRVEHLLFSG